MKKIANIARIAMWVMIGALLLTFFQSGRWITIIWVAAAVVCGICLLLIAFGRNNGRRDRY